MSDLSDLDLVRREAASHQAIVDVRFSALEEIIESLEQQVAGLLAGYAELTGLVECIFAAIEQAEDFNELPAKLVERLKENREAVIKLLEGVNESNMDTGDSSPEESVEDMAKQD